MKKDRLRWFAVIVLFLLSATIAYGAIPQNTIRQDAGIVMPTVNATIEYYRGTLNYTEWLLGKVPVLNTIGDGEVYCYVDGLNFIAVNRTHILYNNTSEYTCLQTALNYTTQDSSGAEVWLAHRIFNYTAVHISPGLWDIGGNTLKVPNKVAIFGSGQGSTRIDGSTNVVVGNMWPNYTFGVTISDLTISGAVSPILEWDTTAASTPSGENYGPGMLKVLNVDFKDATQYSVYLRSTSGDNPTVEFSNVRGSGQGWYLSRIFDSSFHSCSMGTIVLHGGCTANWFSGGYTGGGTQYNLQFTGDSDQWSNYGNIFSGWRFDNPLQTWVDFGGFAQGNLFSGCIFSNINWAATDDTYSGIIHGANTHDNSIVSSHFTNDLESNDAAVLKYVIEEIAGSENNTWVANSYEDNHYSTIELWDRTLGRLLLVADPTVSNFENRKEVYQGGIADNFGDAADRFTPPYGFYSSSNINDYTRELKWWRDGFFANFKVKLTVTPGGGETREAYLWWNSATEYLDISMPATTTGSNSSFIEVDADDTNGTDFAIKHTADSGGGVENNTRPFYTWEFYPRAEDKLGLTK